MWDQDQDLLPWTSAVSYWHHESGDASVIPPCVFQNCSVSTHLRERSVSLSGGLHSASSADCMYSAEHDRTRDVQDLPSCPTSCRVGSTGRLEDCRIDWETRLSEWMTLEEKKSQRVIKSRSYLMSLRAPVYTDNITIFEPSFALRKETLPTWSHTTLCSLRLWPSLYCSQF